MALVELKIADKHIVVLTLNDPDNLNAMGLEMADEFKSVCTNLQTNHSGVRAIVLTGAGRAFSAGGNLEMLMAKTKLSSEQNRLGMLSFYRSFLDILRLDLPIIAAINGHAIGAGLCVACACDIRVAANNAKLGFTFTKLGLHPGMGATHFLPRLIGPSRAGELLMTGRIIWGEEGEQIGLVSKCCDASHVLDQSIKVAKEIAQCGPDVTRQLIASLRGDGSELSKALEREALCQSINYGSKEFLEGITAIKERREPVFP